MPRSLIRTLPLLALLAAGSPLLAQESTAQDAPQPEELFKTLDTNDDGTLAPDEIGEPQRQAFDRLLRVGDVDEDGRLTREEYLKAFQPEPPANGNQYRSADGPPRDGRAQRPDMDRLFEMADRDGDGRIALKDLPEPLQDRLRPMFERLDKEQLTREDFERLGGMRAFQRTGARPQFDAGGLFDRLDKDGNGTISREDLPEPLRQRFDLIFERLGKQGLSRSDFERVMRHLRSEGEAVQAAEAAMRPEPGRPLPALVRVLDADGDGQLTIAEIENLNAKFSELDANGDGKLSGAELTGLAGSLAPRDSDRGGERRDGEVQRPRRTSDSPPPAE